MDRPIFFLAPNESDGEGFYERPHGVDRVQALATLRGELEDESRVACCMIQAECWQSSVGGASFPKKKTRSIAGCRAPLYIACMLASLLHRTLSLSSEGYRWRKPFPLQFSHCCK